ncbi:MAG: tryptophan-rich sensory protein [Deltaproteobacteria bacterium]|nr:MAG: tryptophan-rich sensory protein [Deltaproteobacteria bacterium]
MNRSTLRRSVIVLATLGMIVANGLATTLSPSGKSVGEISDQFQNYFTPPGYVFSIWGLIYSALLAFTVYQALPTQADNPRIKSIEGWYIASCFFNGAWMVVWQRELFPVSLVMMLGLLVSLVGLYVRLDSSRFEVSTKESWFVHWPFSVYLGWITIATVANTTVVLQWAGWDGAGIAPPVWGAILLGVAFLIVVTVTYSRRDKAYMLVLTWASLGIFVKYKDTLVVSITAGVVALASFLIALTLYQIKSSDTGEASLGPQGTAAAPTEDIS